MYTDNNLGNPGKGWKKRTVSCHDSPDFFLSSEYMTVSVIDTLPVFVSVWIRFCTEHLTSSIDDFCTFTCHSVWGLIHNRQTGLCTLACVWCRSEMCTSIGDDDEPECTYTYFFWGNSFFEDKKGRKNKSFSFSFGRGGLQHNRYEEEAILTRSCLRAHSFLSGPRKQ